MATDSEREAVLDQLLRPTRTRPSWLRVAAAIVVVVLAGTWWLTRSSPPPPELSLPMATTSVVVATPTSDEAVNLVVHVAGAVAGPAVVELPEGSRMSDALAAVGGALPDADVDRLNLAAPLVDGGRIFVPFVGQEVPVVVNGQGPPAAGHSGADSTQAIDINAASAGELEQLPGVGPTTAAAIVQHRDDHGPFATVDELERVRGIGPAKLEAIRPDAVVGSG
ncbi:MAG: helix-hairpin-helix domain-containing protein [Acidimicrobiia bacterium]|nr:helix-hairpin-helix domain-containing protein [Acidimicrobiia bacterium]